MFAMYVQRVLVPDVRKVTGTLERKAAAVGCVRLLCHSRRFREDLAPLWPSLLQVCNTAASYDATRYFTM